MSSVDRSALLTPVRDLLSLMKQPYYLEDGVRLDFLLNEGVTGKDLFRSIINNICSGRFKKYIAGFSYYPQESRFSSLQRAAPRLVNQLIENYNGIILVQERNHFPGNAGSLAFFYHRDTNPRLAYLHLYDHLTDYLRIENIIGPWSQNYRELSETVSQLSQKNKRGRR